MKRKLWLFLLLLTGLCLFAACAGPGPEPQPDPVPPPEETVEPRLAYTFPPDEAQLKQVLDDLGLSWTFQERPKFLGDPSPEDIYVLHILSNESGSVDIWLDLRNKFPWTNFEESAAKRADITFNYKDLSIEDVCADFREKDWSSVWALAGELIEARDEVAELKQACLDYFSKFDATDKKTFSWYWYGKKGDIYCRVYYSWYMALEKYDLYQMTLWADQELPQHFLDDVYDISGNGLISLSPENLTPVAELGNSLPSEQEMATYLVLGHLEQLQPVEDESGGLPQQGVLVDESGSVPVYLTTTWLNEYDLVDERVLTVYYINADQPYCIVDPNQSTAEVSRFKNK